MALRVGAVVLLAGVLVGTPARANHCDGGCSGPAPTIGSVSPRVPLDGVLVVPGLGQGVEVALRHVVVTVNAEGEPVAGALERPAGFAVAIWRPTTPWIAGARLTVTTSFDVGAMIEELFGIDPDSCLVDERVQEVEVMAQRLPPSTAPPLIVEATHVVTQRRHLGSLVCCDQAFPRLETLQGNCGGPDVLRIDAGRCASLHATGRLQVRYAVDVGMLPELTANNLATRLENRAPGGPSPLEASLSLEKPACLRFEVLDLARGELFVEERCHGDELAGELGALEVDPASELEAVCVDEPYVCELDGPAWDATRCRPWPEQDGCGCRAGPAAPAWVLLTLLLALGRRRLTRR